MERKRMSEKKVIDITKIFEKKGRGKELTAEEQKIFNDIDFGGPVEVRVGIQEEGKKDIILHEETIHPAKKTREEAKNE